MQSILYSLLLIFSLTSEATRQKHFNTENNLAIQGYDPVSYFTQSKAVKGKKEFAVKADGILYYCSSKEHQNLLLKNYTAYEPQYGGWCAYAMGAKGEKVSVNPETFKISGGKLYLFYNAYFNNTLKEWNKDEAGLSKKADSNWTKIFK